MWWLGGIVVRRMEQIPLLIEFSCNSQASGMGEDYWSKPPSVSLRSIPPPNTKWCPRVVVVVVVVFGAFGSQGFRSKYVWEVLWRKVEKKLSDSWFSLCCGICPGVPPFPPTKIKDKQFFPLSPLFFPHSTWEQIHSIHGATLSPTPNLIPIEK